MSSSDRWASGPPISLLPVELLAEIVEAGLSQDDIVSLAKTSRLMHQRMIPFMYPQLTIYKKILPFSDIRRYPDLETFQRTFFQEDGSRETLSILNVVKDLRVLPQTWDYLRCALARDLATRGNSLADVPVTTHNRVLQALSGAATDIFAHVRKGKLGHFAWMMGHCMPEEILGPQGYITINQSNLKSLSLAVDGSCPGYGLDGLAHLKNLHHFSWRGVTTQRNFQLFRTVVEHNAHHLATLEVEVVRRTGALRSASEIDLDLIWLGLCVPSHRHIVKVAEARLVKNGKQLKSLVSLSLRNVSLAAWKRDDVLTFDPAKLTKLGLEYCPRTVRFFETWDRRNHGITLRYFKTIIDERWGRRLFPLDDLISRHERRLQDLYVSFVDNFDVNINFSLYAASLKRLVLSYFKKRQGARIEANLPDVYSLQGIMQIFPDLEGFAFTRTPYTTRKYLRRAGPYSKLKVLHFRASRRSMGAMTPMVDFDCSTKVIIDSIKQYERYETSNNTAVLLSELVDFAAWAFDCTTFPNLEIIAMGDFSQSRTSIVFRRRDDVERYSQGRVEPLMRAYNEYRKIDSAPIIPFEIVSPEDRRPWEGLEQCREMVHTNFPGEPWPDNH